VSKSLQLFLITALVYLVLGLLLHLVGIFDLGKLLDAKDVYGMKPDMLVRDLSLVSLRRRWLALALLFGLVIWSGFQLLRAEWEPAFAWRWAVVAACVLTYELSHLWRSLNDNRHPGESTLLATLGAANVLTMLRGLSLGLLAGFLFSPWPPGWLAWLPALLYTASILVDYLDGYLARVTHHTTLLGANLDIEFDALGILIATFLAVNYGQLPWWYLPLGLSRYLFLFGIWWRKRRNRLVYDLPPSTHRRVVAGFHMGFSSVMLWPIVYPPGTTLAGVAFAIPFTASFIRDWFVVSGRIDPSSRSYVEIRRVITVIFTRWLPVFLRIGVVLIMAWVVFHVLRSGMDPVALVAWPGLPSPRFAGLVISLVALGATVMLALGGAGRLAALGLLIAASANILASELHFYNGFLLVSAIALMLLGSGMFSCWQPEDAILSRRAGEKERF
jgi:CDP-diacylglycerol--glycerol-3-phosphate 3-phosphatidyltransferase